MSKKYLRILFSIYGCKITETYICIAAIVKTRFKQLKQFIPQIMFTDKNT